MKTKNLEKRLQNIAKNIGSYVIFRLGVDTKGNIGILEIENDDFDDDEEEEDGEIEYPTIIPKINIKKPLTYLEYIG